MFFRLQIISKDKLRLKLFVNFFLSLQKFSLWKILSQLNQTEVVTVLKSPHINKTAQEQFEFRTYKKNILIYSSQPSIFLLLLKKIKNLSFSGLSIKITGLLNKSNKLKKTLNLLSPNNTNISVYSKNFLKYIRKFDCYGEILVRKKFDQNV